MKTDFITLKIYNNDTILKNENNLIFHPLEFHDWFLSDEVELLTFLLLPLAGPEELTSEENDELPLDLQYLPPDKKRETDLKIHIILLECIFQVGPQN